MKRLAFAAVLALGIAGCRAPVALPEPLIADERACYRCDGRGVRHCRQCNGFKDQCRRYNPRTKDWVPTGPCKGSGLIVCERCDGGGQ